MTQPINPITTAGGRVWDILTMIPRAPMGAISGSLEGYSAYKASQATLAPLVAASGENSIAVIVYNFLRNTFGNLFSGGLTGIKNSGILGEVGKAFTKLELGGLSGALGKVGGRGLLLLGGHVGIGALAIIMGTQLAFGAYKKLSDIQKGWSGGEIVKNPLIHGLHAAFGAATAIGGIAMFVNPALGLATVATGFVGSLAISGFKYLLGGGHWFRYPNLAPYPFNRMITSFKTPSVYDGIV